MIVKRPPGAPPVLSIGQERLWYLDQLTPNSAAYNVPFCSRLRGNLDVAALRSSLDAILDRHEALRTVFLVFQGRPTAFVVKKRRLNLKQVDLRGLPEADREAAARRAIEEEAMRPFDLARDLLFRALLIRPSEQEFLFLHNSPHIVFDGNSIAILFRDLSFAYSAFVSGRAPEWSELPFQYSDFAAWQRSVLQGDHLASLSSYWKQQLTGAAVIELPLDYARPGIHTMRGERHDFSMPPDLLAAANRFFRDAGTTAYRGLLSTFYVLLYALSGQTDISIGSPFGPRCRGIENVIGFFVNTVVLRVDLSGDPDFREIMRRVDQVVKAAIAHSDLTLDKVAEAIQPPRDPSRMPLFQVNFRAPKDPYPSLELEGIDSEPPEYIPNGTVKFDLALEIQSSQGKACYFESCADLFRAETVIQMQADYVALLEELISESTVPFTRLAAVAEIRQRARL